MKNQPEIKAFAIDFDFTLAHFVKTGMNGLLKIFINQNISQEIVMKAELEAEQQGFTFDKYLSNIEGLSKKTFSKGEREVLKKQFENWLRYSLVLYEDSMEVIKKIMKKWPIIIVTFGEENYQKQKIAMTNIPYTKIITTSQENSKLKALESIISEYGKPIYFIDDKPSELDEIKKDDLYMKKFITYRVMRPDSPYFHQESKFTHNKISSLRELRLD